MSSTTVQLGSGSSTSDIINRIGYGTMRLTGPHIWGEPANRQEALSILKRAVEGGVNYIDTADYYGKGVTNRLIAESLYPYKDNLVIGTKVGCIRDDAKNWNPYSRPEELRASIENNLKELKLEQIPLVHFRVMENSKASFEESMEAMYEMQNEGLIRHVGVSNVSRAQLVSAMELGNVASVQNLYGYLQRTTLAGQYGGAGGEEIFDILEANDIPLIPYFSLQTSLSKRQEKIEKVAEDHNKTNAQINLAWLLHKSPLILPIPGTTSLKHLEENLDAANISLSEDEMNYLG